MAKAKNEPKTIEDYKAALEVIFDIAFNKQQEKKDSFSMGAKDAEKQAGKASNVTSTLPAGQKAMVAHIHTAYRRLLDVEKKITLEDCKAIYEFFKPALTDPNLKNASFNVEKMRTLLFRLEIKTDLNWLRKTYKARDANKDRMVYRKSQTIPGIELVADTEISRELDILLDDQGRKIERIEEHRKGEAERVDLERNMQNIIREGKQKSPGNLEVLFGSIEHYYTQTYMTVKKDLHLLKKIKDCVSAKEPKEESLNEVLSELKIIWFTAQIEAFFANVPNSPERESLIDRDKICLGMTDTQQSAGARNITTHFTETGIKILRQIQEAYEHLKKEKKLDLETCRKMHELFSKNEKLPVEESRKLRSSIEAKTDPTWLEEIWKKRSDNKDSEAQKLGEEGLNALLTKARENAPASMGPFSRLFNTQPTATSTPAAPVNRGSQVTRQRQTEEETPLHADDFELTRELKGMREMHSNPLPYDTAAFLMPATMAASAHIMRALPAIGAIFSPVGFVANTSLIAAHMITHVLQTPRVIVAHYDQHGILERLFGESTQEAEDMIASEHNSIRQEELLNRFTSYKIKSQIVPALKSIAVGTGYHLYSAAMMSVIVPGFAFIPQTAMLLGGLFGAGTMKQYHTYGPIIGTWHVITSLPSIVTETTKATLNGIFSIPVRIKDGFMNAITAVKDAPWEDMINNALDTYNTNPFSPMIYATLTTLYRGDRDTVAARNAKWEEMKNLDSAQDQDTNWWQSRAYQSGLLRGELERSSHLDERSL